jgi:hypothetical protein
MCLARRVSRIGQKPLLTGKPRSGSQCACATLALCAMLLILTIGDGRGIIAMNLAVTVVRAEAESFEHYALGKSHDKPPRMQ